DTAGSHAAHEAQPDATTDEEPMMHGPLIVMLVTTALIVLSAIFVIMEFSLTPPAAMPPTRPSPTPPRTRSR
ncbi:hypothetical protein D9C01_13710, partial [Corynebacterium diphtheriae]